MKPLFRASMRLPGIFSLALLLFSTQSCYHYRVQAPRHDPGTEYQSQTAHNLFWGLAKSKDIKPANCEKSNALDEVYISTNFGYALLTVATLGIWCPVKIQWKCSKPCNKTGNM